MSAGRTSWFPRDAAWHRRELIVELGDEFGGDTLATLSVIDAWAQEQRAGGEVKGGFRILSRESFVTVSHAVSIVEKAAAIGVLDDLVIDDDGRRFTCRVSGWKTDTERGRAALRQAGKRNQPEDTPEQTVTDRDVNGSVTAKPLPHITVEEKESVGVAREGLAAKVTEVAAVLAQCSHLHVDRVGIENAISAWPTCDPVQAAHEVVTWATDPTFRMTNAARALGSALSKQQERASAPVTPLRPGRQAQPSADEYMKIATGEVQI